MNVRTKKKFSPLFLLVHLSLQPHFLSHTMDLLQRPSFLIDFVGNRKKKREKNRSKERREYGIIIQEMKSGIGQEKMSQIMILMITLATLLHQKMKKGFLRKKGIENMS